VSEYRPDPLGTIGYNPDTGKFIWLQSGMCRRKGDDAGYRTPRGYEYVQFGGKRTPAHHLAWRIMTGKWPDAEIDHINRVKNDNRWCNLRAATRFENARNVSKTMRNTSGFKGVSWHKRGRYWAANIMKDRERIYLGSFRTREEAAAAYAAAAKELHADFHCLD
jgi:hypothetical protein